MSQAHVRQARATRVDHLSSLPALGIPGECVRTVAGTNYPYGGKTSATPDAVAHQPAATSIRHAGRLARTLHA